MARGASFDTREFRRAFIEVLAKHGKDAPTYLKKKTLSVVIGSGAKAKYKGAVQLTKRADRSKINAVPEILIRRVVLKKARLKGENNLSETEIRKRIKREYARRRSAIGYVAGPGWFPAATKFGGKPKGKKNLPRTGFSKTQAAKGGGKLPTKANLTSEIENAGAGRVGGPALQKAVDNIAKDMKVYGAQELMGPSFKKHSVK